MKYFIDFEATQFSNDIISVGCVRENGDEFYSLVNPQKKITSFITELTGITDEMLQQAPLAEKVFSDFFDWCASIEDDLPVFYCYGNADINFVRKNFNKSQNFKAKSILGYLYSDIYDYEPMVRKHFGLIQAVSLIKVTNYYKKEELTQHHNALADARMLKFVYEQVNEHSPGEDSNAFPEYQSSKPKPKPQPPEDDWSSYRVYRMKGGKILETYNTMIDAVKWIIDQLPTQDEKEKVVHKNLVRKIKSAHRNKNKYLNYRWKVEKIT